CRISKLDLTVDVRGIEIQHAARERPELRHPIPNHARHVALDDDTVESHPAPARGTQLELVGTILEQIPLYPILDARLAVFRGGLQNVVLTIQRHANIPA